MRKLLGLAMFILLTIYLVSSFGPKGRIGDNPSEKVYYMTGKIQSINYSKLGWFDPTYQIVVMFQTNNLSNYYMIGKCLKDNQLALEAYTKLNLAKDLNETIKVKVRYNRIYDDYTICTITTPRETLVFYTRFLHPWGS